jgi:hypothetical protein
MDDAARQPRFLIAVASVLLAGVVESYATTLLIGVSPYLSRNVWYLVTSLIGAWAVRLILRAFGFEISYVAAVAALLAGTLVSVAIARVLPAAGPSALFPLLPAFGLLAGIPSLLLSAWVVQISSSGRRPSGFPVAD